MKRLYLVRGEFNYTENSLSPEKVREGFIKSLKREGLNELNFEINIEKVIEEVKNLEVEQQEVPKEKIKLKQKRKFKKPLERKKKLSHRLK